MTIIFPRNIIAKTCRRWLLARGHVIGRLVRVGDTPRYAWNGKSL